MGGVGDGGRRLCKVLGKPEPRTLSPASDPHQRGAHEFPFLAQGRPRVAVVGGAEEGESSGVGPDSGVLAYCRDLFPDVLSSALESFSLFTHTQNTATWTCRMISLNHKE